MSSQEFTSAAAEVVDRERLILDHLPLLQHIVGRMGFDVPGRVQRDDLFGWGMRGLIEAADSYEPARGLQFSTYAYSRIRGSILDELRRLDFLPRGRRDRLREVERTVAQLEQQHGAPPSPEEIAQELGTTVDEIDEVLHSARVASWASLDGGPNEDFGALLSDPRSEDPVGSAEWNEMKALLVQVIGALPEPEKTVISLYYGEELLLKEIGEILGVTESRVSQIHTRALYRLNRELKKANPVT
ncbi:MAG: FliA/WhiG family RNA polymerase sigma factor [Planctomycetes bacterium]|nr:FliA/WhiG family RNA polymerase sigma factor [Planctomycetota bacterium]